MKTHEAQEGRSPPRRSGLHRLLPVAGITAAIVALVGHFVLGGALMHVALPALLVYLGLAKLGAGMLVVGLAVAVTLKLLVAFGAFRWWQQGRSHAAGRGGFGIHQFIAAAARSTASAADREDAMVMRTITVQTHPGQVDELVRRWQAQVAPHIPEVPGLHRVFVCGNRDANTVMAVQFWDTPPDQASHEIHERLRFRDQVRDLLSAEPVAAEFDVLAQV
jgi:hypothetical protein